MLKNKRKTLLLGLLAAGATGFAQFNPIQNDSESQIFIDLNQRADKKVPVEIVPPLFSGDSAIYQMPRMVPGTYKIYDFGRYVSGFSATDAKGKELEVERLDQNRWYVKNGKDLYKIKYWAEASEGHPDKPSIFGPAASVNDSARVLLNMFGYVGYMKGLKENPVRLTVSKPNWMYGSTTLDRVSFNDSSDIFSAQDYFHLHDNPILYAKADTATRTVAGMEIIVGVSSLSGSISAADIMEDIAPIFEATYTYLGDTLPAKKYAVLLHTTPPGGVNNGFGALEHHTSTVVVFPDVPLEYLGSGIRDVVAHEFFHIVTPLNIHSEYISDFDFMKPEMSKHLWLYEGITEYNSVISQKKGGITTEDQFFKEIMNKMGAADQYNKDIPFTMVSKHALDVFENQYLNVYQKGALIGAALDLKLRSLSNGNYGLRNLLIDLGKKYGQDRAFVDDDLFNVITEMTYPEMKEFFARHIESAEPLPWEELMDLVGVTYIREREIMVLNIGNIRLNLDDETGNLVVQAIDPNSDFVGYLDLRRGDQLLELNGEKITADNINELFTNLKENFEDGDKVKLKVLREDEDGELDSKKLSARLKKSPKIQKNVLLFQENPSAEQLNMRAKWLD